jgi:hypothetical protein
MCGEYGYAPARRITETLSDRALSVALDQLDPVAVRVLDEAEA